MLFFLAKQLGDADLKNSYIKKKVKLANEQTNKTRGR